MNTQITLVATPEEQGPKLPEPMTDERLAELRKLDQEATGGKWYWQGNTSRHDIVIMSTAKHNPDVMDFKRWGMQGAQPVFRTPDNWMTDSVEEIVIYEQTYRKDFFELDNPDARMMAQGRQGLHELLQEIYRLRRELDYQAEEGTASGH